MPEQNRGAAENAGRAPSANAIPPGSRPNVVLIVLDDLGYGDLSSYGSPIETPNADRIAREGMTFREAYAGAAVCTPSRAALLTGRYAQRVGLPGVIFPGEPCGLPAFEHTVAEALRGAGYRTGIFGKWHLGDPCRDDGPASEKPRHSPLRHGFDRFRGIPYSNDMGWPRNARPEKRQLPFYSDDDRPWHRGRTGGLRGRKTDPFEGGIRVPFAARWPGKIPAGQSRERICFVDVLPTLVELAGAEPPPQDRTVDGVSLRGALAGESLPQDRMLYFYGDANEGPEDAGSAKWQWCVAAVRWRRWKLLWPRSVWPRVDREQLFDLDEDPDESNDLSGNPDHADVLERLRASAEQFHDEIQRNKEAALRRACPERSDTG